MVMAWVKPGRSAAQKAALRRLRCAPQVGDPRRLVTNCTDHARKHAVWDQSRGVLSKLRKRAEALSIPSPDEVARCLAEADDRFRALIAVCALAGLRLGEAAALKFGDVDYARQQLHVRRRVQRIVKKEVEIRLPKYGSERSVPMPDELAAILGHHESLEHATDWLFAGGEDHPSHENTVGHQWRLTQKWAGVSGIRSTAYGTSTRPDSPQTAAMWSPSERSATRRRARRWTPTPSSGPPARTAPGGPPRASPSKCCQKMWARCGRKSPKWALTGGLTR
ncbi:MAG: phage integrase family protein [Nocardioides sp.]|nr:phage integrase family protein [Nocardioides sp.]